MHTPRSRLWRRGGINTRAAIYQAVEGNSLPFIPGRRHKGESAVNIVALHIPQSDLDAALQRLRTPPRICGNESAARPLPGCGHCDYCRSVKKLDRSLIIGRLQNAESHDIAGSLDA